MYIFLCSDTKAGASMDKSFTDYFNKISDLFLWKRIIIVHRTEISCRRKSSKMKTDYM